MKMFTPGPWYYDFIEKTVSGVNGEVVVLGESGTPYGIRRINDASLICTAPEMFAKLDNIRQQLERGHIDEPERLIEEIKLILADAKQGKACPDNANI